MYSCSGTSRNDRSCGGIASSTNGSIRRPGSCRRVGAPSLRGVSPRTCGKTTCGMSRSLSLRTRARITRPSSDGVNVQLHVDVDLEVVRPQPVVREPKRAVLGLDDRPGTAALDVVRGIVVERDRQSQDAAREPTVSR